MTTQQAYERQVALLIAKASTHEYQASKYQSATCKVCGISKGRHADPE